MKKGFTLAEILITLTIIGIVAVMVIPALTTSINEKAWDTQRRALHTRMSQALAQIDDLSGYGDYVETKDESGKVTDVNDTVTESFVTNALSKVYKIKNTCDVKHLADCGIADDFYTMSGGSITTPKTLSDFIYGRSDSYSKYAPVAVETGNGESLLVYYNKNCAAGNSEVNFNHVSGMCVNIVYDLNGLEGPNRIGKDMGTISAYFKNDPVVVAPMPISSSNEGKAPSYSEDDNNAGSICKKKNQESRLPDREELAALMYNSRLYNFTSGWSGTIATPGKNGTAWGYVYDNTYGGSSSTEVTKKPRNISLNVRCIKK